MRGRKHQKGLYDAKTNNTSIAKEAAGKALRAPIDRRYSNLSFFFKSQAN